jgi:PAS domain S-box-containing protein
MNSCEMVPGNEDTASLASVITTIELSRRPPRPPDLAAENRALLALAQVMAGSPDRILRKLAKTALDLCRAHSAGFSLLDLDGRRFYSPVAIGQWACHAETGALLNDGPCGTVVAGNAPQLMSRPERHFAYLASFKPPIEEALFVPFYLEGEAIGAIWVMSHDKTLRFDAEDLRVMTDLGALAATAYQVMRESTERLREANADVASPIAKIENVKVEVQDSRRAALNVMEDALQARQIADTLSLERLNEVEEPKQTEAAIQESDERYRTLFTLGPVAVYSCDASGVIRDFNPRAVELWGRAPKPGDTDERFCGSYKLHRPDGTFIPHEQCPVAEVLSGKIPEARDAEVHIKRPDGSWVIVIVNVRPLKNQRGEITGALNYFFDITERKHAEALMELQNQTFEMAATGAPLMQVLGFLAHAAESHAGRRAVVAIHLLNEQGTRFGQTVGPNLPANYRLAVDGMEVCSAPGLLGAAIARRRRVSVADVAASEEFAAFASLVSPLGIRAGWSMPILSSNGEVLGTLAKYYYEVGEKIPQEDLLGEIVTRTAATIIESRRAEEARGRLAALVQSSDDAIVSKDLNGMILTWNVGAERLFGYKAHEAIGQPVTMLIPPDHRNEEPGILERIRRGERIEHYETIRRRKDGTLVDISLSVSPIVGEHGRIVGASKIARDITERKRIEEQRREVAVANARRELEAELARVARALTVGELATSIAHEVNQPLAAIVTNAEAGLRWLKAEAPKVLEVQQSLELIIRDGNRASEVIRRIREFLKKDSPQAAPLDINDVAQEAMALVRDDLLKRKITLIVELSDGLPPIRGDRIQLQQVMLNLIMNGSEAINSLAHGSRELVVISQKSGTDSVLLAVRDSGAGVELKNVDRMFQAFFTTKSTGMGLGLSISRSIIEAHGGRIWAAPNEGPGITVQFTLPIEIGNP